MSLRSNGIFVFLATGRTRKEVDDVLPSSIIVDGIVCANGMETFSREEQLEFHVLDQDIVKEVVRLARSKKLYYEIHPLRGNRTALLEDKQYMEAELNKEIPNSLLENEYNSRMEALRSHIEWTTYLMSENAIKVYFFSMNTKEIANWQSVLNKLNMSMPFSKSSSSLHNVEIMVENVSKATGIEKLLHHYDLSAQTLLAIGDGENDLSMFKLASHSVAMKNAADFVKEKADEITTYTYEEDGLYHFLKGYFNYL